MNEGSDQPGRDSDALINRTGSAAQVFYGLVLVILNEGQSAD